MNPSLFSTGIVREVVRLEEVDSTNTYALASGREGLLVIADRQLSGRGRQGRSWFSPAGANIYMTLTVAGVDPRFSIITGVAVSEAVSSIVLPSSLLEIKWPNDLILNGKKVCGILCQSRSGITAIGIGLNVNQKDWPPELEGRATSLAEAVGFEEDKERVVGILVASMAKWFSVFSSQGFDPVREAFLLSGRLESHDLETEDGQPCTVVGMDEDGHLLISVSGETRELVSNSIVLQS